MPDLPIDSTACDCKLPCVPYRAVDGWCTHSTAMQWGAPLCSRMPHAAKPTATDQETPHDKACRRVVLPPSSNTNCPQMRKAPATQQNAHVEHVMTFAAPPDAWFHLLWPCEHWLLVVVEQQLVLCAVQRRHTCPLVKVGNPVAAAAVAAVALMFILSVDQSACS